MILAISILLIASAPAYGSNCCSKVSGSCRSACEKLHHDTIADLETKQQRLLDVRNFCPQYLVPFWKCMNQSEQGFGSDDQTSWAVCCEEALTEKCRRGCKTAFRQSELQHHCRKSDELVFFTCVEKQEAGEDCCGLARSPDCHEMCRRWVQEPGTVSWGVLSSVCTMPVQHCLNNISKPVFLPYPHKYLHCCDLASTVTCKETCRRNLKKRSYDTEIMSNLKESCGPLVLHEGEIKLAQCLLQSEPAAQRKPNLPLGFDGDLAYCCNKAVDKQCATSCFKTFLNNTLNYKEFDKHCQNANEENLLQCNDEVIEPCELGCEGLSYCQEFNSRPSELFRSCNIDSDQAAQDDIATISKGYIKLPNKQKLSIKNLSHCSPDKFKTLACINQIKPCHRLTQTTRVCYEDCMQLMSECANFSKPEAYETASKICKVIAPSNNVSSCIKLDSFVVQESPGDPEVSSPCKDINCPNNEFCRINKSCSSPDDCDMSICTKGCKIGKTENFLIPEKTFAKTLKKRNPGEVCFNICQCTKQGYKTCQYYCKPKVSRCKGIEHGSTYYSGCNLCSCTHGDIVCSKQLCDASSFNNTSAPASTTLPCQCKPHYLPVCGWNGQTYPNECLAKCYGIGTNYTTGACSDVDPCKNARCQRGDDSVCLPKRQVCLATLHANCSQHICVRNDCQHNAYEPVCDTEGVTHASPCKLIKAKKELAYFGPCLANCKSDGEVCGVDGNTYKSECAAHARYIQVDYVGNCSFLGNVHVEPQVQCLDVECPSLAASGCMAYTPPGACCPVCAGAFRALFSAKDVEATLFAFRGHSNVVDQMTVEAVMATLEREVKTVECDLRGQLTFEHDLLVLLVPNGKKGSSQQVREACVREAEKLTVLIQRQSPRLVVPLSTSVLTASRLVHQPLPEKDPDCGGIVSPLPLLLVLAGLANVLAAYFRA